MLKFIQLFLKKKYYVITVITQSASQYYTNILVDIKYNICVDLKNSKVLE